jgi:hypothetical protein
MVDEKGSQRGKATYKINMQLHPWTKKRPSADTSRANNNTDQHGLLSGLYCSSGVGGSTPRVRERTEEMPVAEGSQKRR